MDEQTYYETDNHTLPTIYCREQIVDEKGQLTLPSEYATLHNLKSGSKLHWFRASKEIILSTEMVHPAEEGVMFMGSPDEHSLESLFGTVKLSTKNKLITIPSDIQEDLRMKPGASVFVTANEKSVYIEAIPSEFTLDEWIRFRQLIRTGSSAIDWNDDRVYQEGFHPTKDQLECLSLHSRYILNPDYDGPSRNSFIRLFEHNVTIVLFENPEEEELSKKWIVAVLSGVSKDSSSASFLEFLHKQSPEYLFLKLSYYSSSYFLFMYLSYKILNGEEYSHLGTSDLYRDF